MLAERKKAAGVTRDIDLPVEGMQGAGHGVQGDASPQQRASPFPTSRWSSSGAPSRRCSRAGTPSAPSTTAGCTTSPISMGTAVNIVSHGLRQPRRRVGRPAWPSPGTPRPGERRAVRRVPAERAGRGRGERVTRPGADRAAARRRCPAAFGELERVGAHAGAPLPRRAGPRVHHRERQALHAADPARPAHRATPSCPHRLRNGGRRG